MALRTCLRRAAHQLSSRSLLASAATQSRGLTAAVAGGDDNGGEYVQHIWKSSESQYAAQLASGRWVHVPIKMARNSIEIGAEVIEDTKPAGFDERINIPEDRKGYESLPEAAQAFIDAATSNSVRAKWCMDGAGSIEEAAQMLEAYAAYVRGLSKDGWYAVDSDCDYLNLCRDLIAKEEGEKPAGFERIQDSSDATQVFVEEDPPDQLSTGEEGPAAADLCQRLQTPAGSIMPTVVWKSSEGQYTAELASGKWIGGMRGSEYIDELCQDTKPAGFDECIKVPMDFDREEEHAGTDLFSFIDEVSQMTTTFSVRAKGCMDGATSIEEAAQFLEEHAAYVRGLSKDGYDADDMYADDRFFLCRYFK